MDVALLSSASILPFVRSTLAFCFAGARGCHVRCPGCSSSRSPASPCEACHRAVVSDFLVCVKRRSASRELDPVPQTGLRSMHDPATRAQPSRSAVCRGIPEFAPTGSIPRAAEVTDRHQLPATASCGMSGAKPWICTPGARLWRDAFNEWAQRAPRFRGSPTCRSSSSRRSRCGVWGVKRFARRDVLQQQRHAAMRDDRVSHFMTRKAG